MQITQSSFKRWQLLSLSLLSGTLLSLGWPPLPLTFLMFVALVPLLLAAEGTLGNPNIRKKRSFFWACAYLALLTWNLFTTWWIKNATVEGGVAAIVLNAALQSIPWLVYIPLRRRWGVVSAICGLTLSWLAFEYIHLRWDLTWPWLTLGNAFADKTEWVQWYSLTGHLGGTAWVWWANAALFLGFTYPYKRAIARAVCWSVSIVLLGITVSLSMLPWAIPSRQRYTEVVVVQPNIDPYTTKFPGSPNFMPFDQQVRLMCRLSDSLITPRTHWLLWPETALDATMPEDGLEREPLIYQMRRYVNTHPGLALVVGCTTYKRFASKDDAPASARYQQGQGYYDLYNTALLLRAGDTGHIPIYHKSRLVPGVEGMPYPSVLGPLTALVIDLGGSAGGLGSQPERSVFHADNQAMAPAICYESIFGDFMADFTRGGAQFTGIITNDAWWGNTAGHVQHLNYARLRAIEEHRWIARSGNTGISAYIDPTGRIVKQLGYERLGALRYDVGLSDERTLYTYIGDLGLIVFVALMCGMFVWAFRPKSETSELSPLPPPHTSHQSS